jgi:hypothetical protein
MLVRLVSLGFVFSALTAVAVGCSTSEGTDVSTAALGGDIATARACAVRDTYRASDLDSFQTIAWNDLPAGVRRQVDDLSQTFTIVRFSVSSIGLVYVIQPVGSSQMSFYDVNGALLAMARGDDWLGVSGAELRCDGSGGGTSGGTSGGGSSGTSGGTHPNPCGPHGAMCGGKCVDLLNDNDNCGSCGFSCGPGGAGSDWCAEGQCQTLG